MLALPSANTRVNPAREEQGPRLWLLLFLPSIFRIPSFLPPSGIALDPPPSHQFSSSNSQTRLPIRIRLPRSIFILPLPSHNPSQPPGTTQHTNNTTHTISPILLILPPPNPALIFLHL